ncbi:MAG: S-layer homology domain-containing protein, partial [Patescibacteria group bacterium]
MHRSAIFSLVAAILFVPLAVGAAGLSVMIDGRTVVFSDVPEDAWFSTYVQQAAEAGIVSGYRDMQGNLTGKFGPGDPVTIAQALKIAVEGAGYSVTPISAFNCSGPCHWATGYVQLAHDRHFPFFATDGEYLVEIDRPAIRAEVAQIFVDAYELDFVFEPSRGSSFRDVDPNGPHVGAIEVL